MKILSSLEIMRQKKTDYTELYQPADKFFCINDLDPDRKTIVLSLPKPPPLHLIDGYGEHPDNQYFKRFKTPQKLLTIEREVLRELQDIQKGNRQETVTGYKIIDRFWDKIEEERDDLEKEIDYIRKIWYFRLYGYWFFNDGKPTYITGRHFMFLNFFYQPDITENDGYPEYRDRHRREFLFREYLRHATETFAKRDERGWAVSEDDNYQTIDVGSRVSYGDIQPKNRRNGSTMMGLCDMIESSERAFGIYSTLISKDGDSTEEAYNLKLLPSWVNRPYFLKPVWQGSSQPTQIKYFPPKNYFTNEALMSIIDYTVSAGETKKDGSKLNGDLLQDEEGKQMSGVNVLQRWDINKNALALGDGTKILGYSSHITTVEDINAAGLAFLDMLELSDFYQRGDNGQTISGLMAMMFPAYDGLENFIDKFGMSVIDTPTERQCRLRPDAIFASIKKGAKQYQQEKRDDFLKQGTPAALQSYRAYVKKYPWKTSELYISTISDMGFDYEILDTRIMELRKLKSLGKMPYKVGNFYRVNNNPEGDVYWKTEEGGKFELSMELPPSLINQKRKTLVFDSTKGMMVPAWRPMWESKFTCGIDPIEYRNTKNLSTNKQSDVGMAILWEYDSSIDKSDDPRDWQSGTFVLSYQSNPQSEYEYCEDCLMACEYFSAMCFPENNKTGVIKHFIDRGRGGYLKYSVDPQTGMPKDKPGYYAGVATKNEGFTEIKNYISFHGHKEKHLGFMEQVRSCRGVDDLTNNDKMAGHMAALMGSKSSFGKMNDRLNTQTIDLGKVPWLKKHSF